MAVKLLMVMLLWGSYSWASPESSGELLNFSHKQQEEVLVVKAVNSDLIVLEDGRRIKLIGVESAGQPQKKYVKRDEHGQIVEEAPEPTIPLEEQALTYAQELVENKKVKLEYDVESRDIEGYLCAYAFLSDGRMVNIELLRMGFVKLRIMPPNVKHADELRAAYLESKKEKRGLQGE